MVVLLLVTTEGVSTGVCFFARLRGVTDSVLVFRFTDSNKVDIDASIVSGTIGVGLGTDIFGSDAVAEGDTVGVVDTTGVVAAALLIIDDISP
jgi:hypothetical protein